MKNELRDGRGKLRSEGEGGVERGEEEGDREGNLKCVGCVRKELLLA